MNKNVKLAIVIVLFLLFAIFLNTILMYIVVASIVSLIGSPIVEKLQKIKFKKQSLGSGLASLLTMGLMITIATVIIVNITPIIGYEVNSIKNLNFDFKSLGTEIKSYIEFINNYVNNLTLMENKNFDLISFLNSKLENIFSSLSFSHIFSGATGFIGSLLAAIFSVLFISFFFLKSKNLLSNIILLAIPVEFEEKTKKVMVKVKHLLTRYFIGLICQLSSIFILLILGLSIVGLEFKHAIVIAAFSAIFNIIPYIGPLIGIAFGFSIGTILGLNLDFYSELVPRMIGILVSFGLVQLVDNIVLQPLIFSNSVKAHPLEIFLVILIAGQFFGILGMVVAIPIYTILRVIIQVFFEDSRIVQKMNSIG